VGGLARAHGLGLVKYALVVLTHGDERTLEATLASFDEMVVPESERSLVFRDEARRGFCNQVRHAWEFVSTIEEVDYVFWLEHDFRFLRPVDLRDLAEVLDRNPMICQMALMRDAINDSERSAGGAYRFHSFDGTEYFDPDWLEHSSNFTTNPSLMRREFMRSNPWPDYQTECEGKFSADLRRRGYMYGAWDLGEVYVEHTGALRTGHGY
jgi:hypothetical protein